MKVLRPVSRAGLPSASVCQFAEEPLTRPAKALSHLLHTPLRPVSRGPVREKGEKGGKPFRNRHSFHSSRFENQQRETAEKRKVTPLFRLMRKEEKGGLRQPGLRPSGGGKGCPSNTLAGERCRRPFTVSGCQSRKLSASPLLLPFPLPLPPLRQANSVAGAFLAEAALRALRSRAPVWVCWLLPFWRAELIEWTLNNADRSDRQAASTSSEACCSAAPPQPGSPACARAPSEG